MVTTTWSWHEEPSPSHTPHSSSMPLRQQYPPPSSTVLLQHLHPSSFLAFVLQSYRSFSFLPRQANHTLILQFITIKSCNAQPAALYNSREKPLPHDGHKQTQSGTASQSLSAKCSTALHAMHCTSFNSCSWVAHVGSRVKSNKTGSSSKVAN